MKKHYIYMPLRSTSILPHPLYTHTNTHTHTHTEREREREREKERETETETERQRDRDRETETQTESQSDKQTEEYILKKPSLTSTYPLPFLKSSLLLSLSVHLSLEVTG